MWRTPPGAIGRRLPDSNSTEKRRIWDTETPAAARLAAALAMDGALRGLPAMPFPADTMTGALLHYLAHAAPRDFAPTNAMLGLLPALAEGAVDARALKKAGGTRALRAAKGGIHRARALASLEAHLQAVAQPR